MAVQERVKQRNNFTKSLCKVCAKALERRMISIVQPQICKIQLWFRKYISDIGALLSLRQLNEKCIECDGQLNTAFIDQ